MEMKGFLQIKNKAALEAHALCNTGLMYYQSVRWEEDEEAERETNKGESHGAWMGKGLV